MASTNIFKKSKYKLNAPSMTLMFSFNNNRFVSYVTYIENNVNPTTAKNFWICLDFFAKISTTNIATIKPVRAPNKYVPRNPKSIFILARVVAKILIEIKTPILPNNAISTDSCGTMDDTLLKKHPSTIANSPNNSILANIGIGTNIMIVNNTNVTAR